MKRIEHQWWLAPLAALLALQFLALALYWRDQRYLARLMDGIASPSLPPSEQAKQVVAFLSSKSPDSNESYFLLPIFHFLRATPRQIAEQGGDCADRSRLLIALLELRGISASKWALYSPDLRPQHAVAELQAEHGKMVVDSLFGLWFPRPQVGYYGIQELRQDPRILEQRVQELRAQKSRPGALELEGYPLDRFIYTYARTINWDKSVAARLLHRGLHGILGERVNHIRRPTWVEQPALMVVIGLTGIEGVYLCAVLLVARSRRRERELAEQRSSGSSTAIASAAAGPAGLGRPRI